MIHKLTKQAYAVFAPPEETPEQLAFEKEVKDTWGAQEKLGIEPHWFNENCPCRHCRWQDDFMKARTMGE